MNRFNLHSVATAMLVEAVVMEVRVDFPEGAFIAGMLHDIGKLLIAVTLPESFQTIVSLAEISDAPFIECEREVLEFGHAELSALAIQRWELAEQIQQAVRFHHEPERAIAEPGKVSLSLVINRADAFINHVGMSLLPQATTIQRFPSLEFPGFPYSPVRVIENFEREWKTVGGMFR